MYLLTVLEARSLSKCWQDRLLLGGLGEDLFCVCPLAFGVFLAIPGVPWFVRITQTSTFKLM